MGAVHAVLSCLSHLDCAILGRFLVREVRPRRVFELRLGPLAMYGGTPILLSLVATFDCGPPSSSALLGATKSFRPAGLRQMPA